MNIDALIIGAGPVGLTMAATLSQQGRACRIIDKAPTPTDKSKALVIWSRTLELLDKLKLATTFVDAGMKARGASIYQRGERLVHVEIGTVDSPFNFPLMIPQSETERLLAEHLAAHGVQVERSVELVSFSETAEAMQAVLRHADGREETISAPWLIGCDGAHSTVRHALGMEFTGEAEPNDWLLADVHITGPVAPDEISIFWHELGVLAFFPITRDRFRVIADTGTSHDIAAPPAPTLAEVQAKVDERGPTGVTLADPVWLASFRINERKVADYRRGRVMLAGDAAHIHSPAGGQGMNTGMQDAFNLAWKLALVTQGKAQAEPLLASYSAERSAVGDQVLRNASMMTSAATIRSPVAQYLRAQIAPIVSSFGVVQDRMKNMLSELSINYRHGPLSANDWPLLVGGIPAGDRLPEAPLIDAKTGAPTTIFAALRDANHALLLLPGARQRHAIESLLQIASDVDLAFGSIVTSHLIVNTTIAPAEPLAAPDHVRPWLDRDGRIQHQHAADEPTLILVRPDGYIAYRNQPASAAQLLKYLDRYLVRREQ